MAQKDMSVFPDEAISAPKPVAFFGGPMPNGVTVSQCGRIFVNYPKWGDNVRFTVAELREGIAHAYPDQAFNTTNLDDPAAVLMSVQSVVVGPVGRLWILHTGSPLFKPTEDGGPKLVCVDLPTDKVIRKILLPQDVAPPTTNLTNMRFDLRQGAQGMVYITDSSEKGPNSIIVVDLASGKSWRRLHDHPSTRAQMLQKFIPVVEGRPFIQRQPGGGAKLAAAIGADGIAISADGSRLFYCPLASRRLYSVSTKALADRFRSDEDVAGSVVVEGTKAAAPTAWNRMRMATSMPLTTNAMPSCGARRRGFGRPWGMMHACFGQTRCRLLRMAIYTLRPISCTGRPGTMTRRICVKSPMCCSG